MDRNAKTSGLRSINSSRPLQAVWRYAWEEHKLQLGSAAAAIVALVVAMILFPALRPPSTLLLPSSDWVDWHQKIQTFLGLGTLLVAALVWYGDVGEEWEQDIPRLLTCAFFYDNQPAIVCWHAYLASEADIRAWSQQIGGTQMTGQGFLKLHPDVEALPLEKLTDGKRIFVHHRVRLTLTDLPPILKPLEEQPGGVPCLVWYPRHRFSPPEIKDAIPSGQALVDLGADLWSRPDPRHVRENEPVLPKPA